MVNLYKKELAGVPGISFQEVAPDCLSVYKDFTILVDEKKFGRSRDEVLKELQKRKIECKVYFYPPLHKKNICFKDRDSFLPQTDYLSSNIMSLPLYSHVPERYVIKVCSVIKKLGKK